MANFDDDDFDLETPETGETAPADGGKARTGGNRNFLIAAGILGGIFVLLVIVLLVVAFVLLPQRRAQQQAANDAIATQNAVVELQATQTAIEAEANAQINTPTVTPTAQQATATFTQVVAQPTDTPPVTATLEPTEQDARTATVAALLTQAAEAKITHTPTGAAGGGVVTSTALPTTGFADEVGLPGLLGLSLVLIMVIILVRRLRFSTSA